jgi:hypothetical protein
MKFKVSTIYLIFLIPGILILPQIGMGQSHYLLSSFNAEKNGKRVILNWAIKQGSTCIGINILRSSDTLNFKEIGNIQGICGSIEFEQRYTYIDENPLSNQTNYYKLELGFSGRTKPALGVNFVNLENNTSKVVPNPNNGFGTIHFSNPNNQKVKIYIKDSNGKYVETMSTDQQSINFDERHFTKNSLGFNTPTNMYFYTIVSDNEIILSQGQITIIH